MRCRSKSVAKLRPNWCRDWCRVPELPPPIRGSLEPTYNTGFCAVPVTKRPVTSRVVTFGLSVPLSSWFGICWINVIVSVAVTL